MNNVILLHYGNPRCLVHYGKTARWHVLIRLWGRMDSEHPNPQSSPRCHLRALRLPACRLLFLLSASPGHSSSACLLCLESASPRLAPSPFPFSSETLPALPTPPVYSPCTSFPLYFPSWHFYHLIAISFSLPLPRYRINSTRSGT